MEFSPTQIRILESYLKLCQKESPSNVTLQKVADHAKLAFGTVRYNFAEDEMDLTTAGLLYAVTRGQRFIETYLKEAEKKKSYNGLAEYILGTFEWIREEPSHASFLFYFYYLTTTSYKLPFSNEDFITTARRRVQTLLYECIGRGLYKPVGNVEALSIQIHTLVVGAGLVVATTKSEAQRNKLFETTFRAIESLILAARAD
ncbi:MAG TPA: hypothetical protein VFV50_19220 [Bdellovibrionales bacterium]|nr:hypothetical protein [Bdellovibrionales bacterium]